MSASANDVPKPIRMSRSKPPRMRAPALHAVLRERIALLQYPPGSRLSEHDLAAEFGVSRTPIREALQRLAYEGLVVSRHGVGTTVTAVDLKGLRQIYSLRMRLAELIGELSPRLPTPAIVSALEALAARCRQLEDEVDPGEFGRINIALHEQVLLLIGNAPLRQVTDVLFYQTARMWLQLMAELDWRREVRQLHNDISLIAEAARAGDTRAIGFILRNAISTVLVRLGQYLSDPRT